LYVLVAAMRLFESRHSKDLFIVSRHGSETMLLGTLTIRANCRVEVE
jgi:hypothetical protein